MSREYVQQRLREINARHVAEASTIKVDGCAILWSLTAGCWMLCDFKRGTCERLTELCADCPPRGYPTDATRCDECPRRAQPQGDDRGSHG